MGDSSASMSLPAQTLQNKVAIVTGGSRGLGSEMVIDLAKRGARVVICYASESSKERVDGLIQQINSLPSRSTGEVCAQAIQADLSDADSATHIVSAATNSFATGKKIDIIVNNAAVELVKAISEITSDNFAYVYNINVRAPHLLLRAAMPHLGAAARIINVSSVGARCGFEKLSMYTSSKAALEGLTRSWAAELGTDGTTVNAIAPGPVESDMLANIPQNIVQAQKAGTPVQKRVGTPKEIASVVSWLAGKESGWVSGQVINLSGGGTMY